MKQHFLFITTSMVVYTLSVYIRVVQSSGCPCRATLSLEDVIANHVLLGHVISTTPVADVGQCFHLCVYSNMACKSFNAWKRELDSGFWCELNEENKDVDRHALVGIAGRNYYEVNSKMLAKPHYFKDCNCKHYVEFTCECQEGYYGNQCDKKAHSCQDYFRFKQTYSSGIYVVFDGKNTTFSVYCDMDAKNMSAWTLVLSYALQYNTDFNSTPFFVDNPLDEDNPNWSFYRLSLSRMYSIRNSSSELWRVSCNYATYGIDKRDYAVAKWTDIDLLSLDGSGCYRFTYIDIRGSHCSNCTTWIHQGFKSRMFLVAARYGQNEGCNLVATPGSSLYEESFGYYTRISRQFRCTADGNSTTEFWFGGKI